MKRSTANLLLTSVVPVTPKTELSRTVALDSMFCATKVFNGLLWCAEKKRERYGWSHLPNDLPFLNKSLHTLPRKKGLHSLVAQGVRDEVHEAIESHQALLANGHTQHKAPKGRKKTSLTNLTYVMGNGCHLIDGELSLSCGLRRQDNVREMQFQVHLHPGVIPFTKIQTVTLVYDTKSGQFSAHLTGIPPMRQPHGDTVTPRKASIDLGMKIMAALQIEDGPNYLLSAGLLRSTQYYWMKVRQKLQGPQVIKDKDGKERHTRGSRRWYQVREREQRQVDHILHIMTLALVERLWFHGVTVVAIGDLTGITEDKNLGKVNNKYLHAWPFAKFVEYLTYKCKLRGIKVVPLDERGTSRTCHKCKKVDKIQRVTRGWYECGCGYSQHADVNGSCNIFEKLFGASPLSNKVSPPWSIGPVTGPAVVPMVCTRTHVVELRRSTARWA